MLDQEDESRISTSLPRMIAVDEKYCSRCNSLHLFRFYPGENDPNKRLRSSCPRCKGIAFVDTEAKYSDLLSEFEENQISVIKNIKGFKRTDLLKHHFNTQSMVTHSIKDSFSIPFEFFYQLIVFIQMTYEHGSQKGSPAMKSDYLKLWYQYLKMNEIGTKLDEVRYGLVKMDYSGNRYYSYRHARRTDGMGEYGSASRSRLEYLFEDQREEYKRELEHYLQIKDIPDHFTAFEQNDPDTIEFVENFSKSIQSTRTKVEMLKLKHFLTLDVTVKQVREWRKQTFQVPELKNSVSIQEAKYKLEKILGQERGRKAYEFLIMTSTRLDKVPYALDIEGRIYLVQSWAYFVEILLLSESEGEEKSLMLQAGRLLDSNGNVMRGKSELFEKNIVPNLFKINKCQVVDGFKQPDQNGNIIFEIDQFVLDDQNTLWVVEIKSKTHSKRFMELTGWERECREYVDRPDRNLSYPQVVEMIRNGLENYKSTNRIPNNWEIRDIQGLIVVQLPPFEESYNGIYLIDYKEIKQFLHFYSSVM